MKRRNHVLAKLDYPAALRLMNKGSRLIQTNGKRRPEFSVSPGGDISEMTANRILGHSLCKEEDVGLLANTVQSWKFEISDP